jgi:hypothetical protein
VSNDWEIRVISQGDNEFVNHKTKDTHLSSTSVVELDGTLLELGLFIKVIPSEVNVSVAEVTNEFVASSGDILHEGNLKDTNEGNDLDKSSSGDGIRAEDGGNTIGVGVEGVARVVNVSGQVDSSTGGDLSKEGELTDTSVLDLDVTETVESLLVNITTEQTKGVKEAKRRLSTKFIFETSRKSSLGDSLGGRGEGSSRGQKGREDSELHLVILLGLYFAK